MGIVLQGIAKQRHDRIMSYGPVQIGFLYLIVDFEGLVARRAAANLVSLPPNETDQDGRLCAFLLCSGDVCMGGLPGP